MDEWARKANVLANAPQVSVPAANPKDHVACGRCHRWLHVSEIVYHWTGVCRASDALCPECRRMAPQHALVVCIGCQAVVARMAPAVLKSGFRIEARRIYHTNACPNCQADIQRSVLIEAELFRRRT